MYMYLYTYIHIDDHLGLVDGGALPRRQLAVEFIRRDPNLYHATRGRAHSSHPLKVRVILRRAATECVQRLDAPVGTACNTGGEGHESGASTGRRPSSLKDTGGEGGMRRSAAAAVAAAGEREGLSS